MGRRKRFFGPSTFVVIFLVCMGLMVGFMLLGDTNTKIGRWINKLRPPETGSVSDLSPRQLGVPVGQSGKLPAPPSGTPDDATLEWYINWLVFDAERTWDVYLTDSGLQVAHPRVLFVTRTPKKSDCSDENGHGHSSSFTTDSVAAFCAIDGSNGALWFPLKPLFDDWSAPHQGPYAIQMVVDHEYGHFVQWWLQQRYPWARIPSPGNPDTELIATCFSGAMGFAMYYENGAYTLDQAEADLQRSLYDVQHGTAAQEAQAYRVGFDSGKPTTCITTYWPHAHF